HFHLLGNRYFLVVLFAAIEVTQRHLAKCADRGKVTSAQLVFLGPGREPCDELFVLVENQRVGALRALFEHSNVHKGPRFLCVAHNSSAIVMAAAIFIPAGARSRISRSPSRSSEETGSSNQLTRCAANRSACSSACLRSYAPLASTKSSTPGPIALRAAPTRSRSAAGSRPIFILTQRIQAAAQPESWFCSCSSEYEVKPPLPYTG